MDKIRKIIQKIQDDLRKAYDRIAYELYWAKLLTAAYAQTKLFWFYVGFAATLGAWVGGALVG